MLEPWPSLHTLMQRLIEQQQLWLSEIFLIVLITLGFAAVVSRVLTIIKRRADSRKNLWDDALIVSLPPPLKGFIWLTGLSLVAALMLKMSHPDLFAWVLQLQDVLAILIVAWFLRRFISAVEHRVVDLTYVPQPMDKTTALAVGKLLRVSVMIAAALIAIQALGYSISGVLAFGGIGGIAVGFAARDLLANFFGGLMIYLDRPFSVGDWVRSPDKNIEGTIEDIGWRVTCIRTFDKRPLYVPNATFTQISVENPSRMSHRRIYETLGIRYDDADKIAIIIAEVKTMLLEHPEIDCGQTLIVNFNAWAPSSLDFFIYCFTKTTDWTVYHQIKQDIMIRVMHIIAAHGAECAFPTTTIHVPNAVATAVTHASYPHDDPIAKSRESAG